MRFTALDLRNYGPFQHAPVLDLSGGERGLHLIVGPNEAGKSTALRAIRALLFDFPHSTPDNHGRDLATLRVGATLRNEAGDETRLPPPEARDQALDRRRPDRAARRRPDPFLGGLDEATFVDLFSTDHAELVAGGQRSSGAAVGSARCSSPPGPAWRSSTGSAKRSRRRSTGCSRRGTPPSRRSTRLWLT